MAPGKAVILASPDGVGLNDNEPAVLSADEVSFLVVATFVSDHVNLFFFPISISISIVISIPPLDSNFL
jgi:hypothetical protein